MQQVSKYKNIAKLLTHPITKQVYQCLTLMIWFGLV